MTSQSFLASTIKFALFVSVCLAVALIAFTALIVLLPIAIVGGLALHLYIRRLRREARRQSPDVIIEGEYRILDRH